MCVFYTVCCLQYTPVSHTYIPGTYIPGTYLVLHKGPVCVRMHHCILWSIAGLVRYEVFLKLLVGGCVAGRLCTHGVFFVL